MRPNPPQPGSAQHGQPPMAGGSGPWGGGPGPSAAPPRPRANATAAVIAGVLALIAAAMFLWFAVNDAIYASGPKGRWTDVVVQNVISGFITAGALLVAAGFTFARRVSGAWTLCGLCTLIIVANFVAPLLRGTDFNAQLKFLFGFGRINSVIIGLATIFTILTAIAAAIAGSGRSRRTGPEAA
ncbi:hypothetical protein ACQPW3_26325 [Actinosynnema sp. CA-248983]